MNHWVDSDSPSVKHSPNNDLCTVDSKAIVITRTLCLNWFSIFSFLSCLLIILDFVCPFRHFNHPVSRQITSSQLFFFSYLSRQPFSSSGPSLFKFIAAWIDSNYNSTTSSNSPSLLFLANSVHLTLLQPRFDPLPTYISLSRAFSSTKNHLNNSYTTQFWLFGSFHN